MPIEDEQIPNDEIMLNEITHICIVVRDLNQTAENFSKKFGVGPFTIREVTTPESHGEVKGQPAEYTLKFGYAQAGSVVLELVQPVKGETVYDEFLRERGEGIHHIGFSGGSSLDDELSKWDKNGIDPVQVNRRDDPKYGWAYMNTEDEVGCTLEIVCDPPLGWWNSVSLSEDLKGPLGENGPSKSESGDDC